MAADKRPDPLKPGTIPGQNPAPPKRLPGHTALYDDFDRPEAAGNEEDLGGRPAFLFTSGEWAGITLDSSGANLPQERAAQPWVLTRYVRLGVRDVGLPAISPEPILRGLVREGYFVWRTTDPSRMAGTSQ